MVSVNTALVAGDKLGRFQLLLPIGAGGMGRVWVAREDKTGRLFAIKTTLADEKAAGEFWNVLLDEARIAAQVQHRGVCAIHAFELDEHRGVPYLVMDFSDGGSLFEVLDATPGHRIEPVLAAGITALVCGGLQAAHDLGDETGASLGVVHRDVSPQNILISAAGEVQLTDFGVAKARGRLHAATETGEVKGKLSYMAPEQVTTRNVDCRADVFALGCVLYEATVGERPFHGEDAVATMYQLLEEPLRLPSTRLAGYPPALEEIVVKALQRNPADRYQRAEDLGWALSVWIAAQGRIVSEREIATLMRDCLGAKIAERTRRITVAEREIDNPPAQGEQTLTGSSANTPSVPLATPTPKAHLKRTLVVAMACALMLLGVAVARRSKHRDPSPVAATTASSASPDASSVSAPDAAAVPTVDPVETVSITLRAEPARAVLFLDDGAALPNPYTFSAARGDAEHHLRAVAAGFGDRTQEVRFDGNKEVLLTLSTLARTPMHTRSPVTTTSEHVEPTSARPGDLPTVVKKQPRTLDSDNPFARP